MGRAGKVRFKSHAGTARPSKQHRTVAQDARKLSKGKRSVPKSKDADMREELDSMLGAIQTQPAPEVKPVARPTRGHAHGRTDMSKVLKGLDQLDTA